jgi:electron transfer flavoprotein-quinone oxidoreductase
LRTGRPVHSYGVGIKEVVRLDAGRIEERFNLKPGQGAARLYVGRVTRGLSGGGFLYTNRDSLSIGLVVQMQSLQQWKSKDLFPDLLEAFKQRPDLAPLLAGGETIEYGAHLIPEGGIHSLPSPGIPGLLLVGDAAGLVMNTGAVLRGMDLALASGVIAGRSIAASLAEDKSGAGCLERYTRDLRGSFVMNQMKIHKRAARVLARERLYQRYPHRMVRWATDLFRVGEDGTHLPVRKAWKKLRKEVLGFGGLRDLWRVIRM